jgi:hypothetical protein
MSFINKENIKTKYKALNLVAAKLWVLHYYPPKRSFVLETKIIVTTYLVITTTNNDMTIHLLWPFTKSYRLQTLDTHLDITTRVLHSGSPQRTHKYNTRSLKSLGPQSKFLMSPRLPSKNFTLQHWIRLTCSIQHDVHFLSTTH